MTREELLRLRQDTLDVYKKRVQMGEYDANAGDTIFMLRTMVDILTHQLETQKNADK